MVSDRFKRKEGRTLEQRWRMKHKDRADDIPNCPSIEDIVNMPTPNLTSSSEQVEVKANESTDNTKAVSGSSADDLSVEPPTLSTAQEASPAQSDNDDKTTEPTQRSSCSRGPRSRRRRHRAKRYRWRHRSVTSSDFAIQAPASERRDDIPMCPDIENICDLDRSQMDDDMSLQRFSHALYQLIDDFIALLSKTAQFSKKHPRPTTILGFIVASYVVICYLELSIAALIELAAQASWPIFHALLIFVERFTVNFGSFMHSSDDIMQGAYCDVAELWCRHFQMMCSDRCSFFNMALERLRKN